MSGSCDVIVVLTIYGQFAAIRKADFGHMVYKTYTFSLTITFYLSKPGNRTKKSLTQPSCYCFE